jgi:hypothetical protein
MNRALLSLLLLLLLWVSSQNQFPDSKTNPGQISLQDVAAASGIMASLRCGGSDKQWIPEANGSGAAWLDYDNDGWMDLLIVNGSSMDELRKIVSGLTPQPQKEGVYLYRNLGNGHFQDVTAKAEFSTRIGARGRTQPIMTMTGLLISSSPRWASIFSLETITMEHFRKSGKLLG